MAQGETETLTVGSRSYEDVPKYFSKRFTYDANGDLTSRSVPFAKNQYGRSDAALRAWKVGYERDAVGNPQTITDARGNAFDNAFFDTGNIRFTERPSWWALNYGQDGEGGGEGGGGAGQANPDPGQRYKAGDGGVDTDVAQGGPQLTERDGRSENAEQSEDVPELPSSDGQGNFASVDPEELPGMLPKKGRTTFAYDKEMRLTGVSDGSGDGLRERTVGYDDAGRMTRKVWPYKVAKPAAGGNPAQPARDITHTFAYDGNGNLNTATAKAVADVGDVATTYSYDGYDRRSSETTPGAQAVEGGTTPAEVTKFAYDPNGNLTARETPRGVASTDDPNDFTFRFAYDSLDRLNRETNPAGEAWAYRSDAAANKVLERSPLGNRGTSPDASYESKFEYDSADRMTKKTDPLPSATQDPVDRDSTFSYDDDGNRIKTESPGAQPGPDDDYSKRVSETEHDGRGLPWKESTGSGGESRMRLKEFDPNGNLRRIVTPEGVNGENAATTDDGSNAINGNVKDASKHASVRLYDEDDLLTDIFLPWGEGESRAGDGEVVDADKDGERYRQTFTRDSKGRVAAIFSPYQVGATTAPQVSYSYFQTDWVASSSDEELKKPGTNERIYRQNVRYDYDERGNQTLWQTQNFGENAKGRKITRSFHDNGLLKARKAQKVEEDGSADELTSRKYEYYYNGNRSLTQMQDDDPGRSDNPQRTTNFSRDPAERELVVNETWSKGKDTVFSYDDAGNVASRKTDGARNAATGAYGDTPGSTDKAKTTSFTYDRLDRERQATVQQGSQTREHSKTWWPSGELRKKTRQKASGGDQNFSSEEWFYSAHGDKDFKRRKREGATEETKDTNYSYDANGNRTRDERGEHAFNSRDQLVWWKRSKKKPGTTVSYEVNGTGAVEKKTDSAEPANKRTTTYNYRGTRLLSSEDADTRSEYRYDDFGNAVKIDTKLKESGTTLPPVNELPSAPQTCGEIDSAQGDKSITRYCYDEFERMVAAKGPGLGTDAEKAVYTYDGFDRRDTKRIKKGSSDVTRDYGYVGTSKMLSREQNRAGKTKYYDYSAEGEREGQATANAGSSEPSKYRTYSKDANGSVTELEDEQGSDKGSDGKTNEYDYDPYGELDRAGEPEGEEGEEGKLGEEAKDNPFRFEGFYYDSGVKTYDMGARQYRPESGRFLSQDRYESAQGDLELQADPLTQNRYAFAGGNPVNNVEFDGHHHCGSCYVPPLFRRTGFRYHKRRSGASRPPSSGGSSGRSGGYRTGAAASATRLFDTAPRLISPTPLTTPLLRQLAPPPKPPPLRRDRGLWDYLKNDTGGDLEGLTDIKTGLGDPTSATYQKGKRRYSRTDVQIGLLALDGVGLIGRAAKGTKAAVGALKEGFSGARATRKAYVDGAREIRDFYKSLYHSGELDLETAARGANEARNALKAASRQDTPRLLRIGAARFNKSRYGNPIGKTYDDYIRQGKSPEMILNGSGKTNPRINRAFGVR